MTSSEYFHLIHELRKKVSVKTLFVAGKFKGSFLWLDLPCELALLPSECVVVRDFSKKAGDACAELT